MARLTEQEQQEVVRYLEADKPLPDKFRFLLFEDKREVELVWNGKTSEVCNIVLPFQVIEQVDEPRAEKPEHSALQAGLFDARGRQLKGWTNKLIWGDNKLILSSLKNGPLREEIEKQGGLKLIYIDPPFDVGADFSMDIEIGDDTFTKKPQHSRRDRLPRHLGKRRGFLHRDDLRAAGADARSAGRGRKYLCALRLASEQLIVRLVLDEMVAGNFGTNYWKRTTSHSDGDKYWDKLTTRSVLRKVENVIWNRQFSATTKHIDKYYPSRSRRGEDDIGRSTGSRAGSGETLWTKRQIAAPSGRMGAGRKAGIDELETIAVDLVLTKTDEPIQAISG